jgi:hypothetical protein
MIPPFCDEKTVSDGERKLFRAFQNMKGDYTILHSLGIAQHRDKIFGEIDFVILCSEGVLCLEVKGGRVYRKDGVWVFVNRNGEEHPKAEGPFRQVLSAMFSLRDHLKRHFGSGDPLVECLYACGVMFPDMPFAQKGPEIIDEIVFDSRGSQNELGIYIDRVFTYWREQLRTRHGFAGVGLSQSQIVRLEKYLRGDFGFVPSLGYIVEKTEERLLALTEEQMDRLAMASENPRILLKGGAGTGKTLLSMEFARRSALAGRKVLYLCYNRNLSRHLRNIIEKGSPEVEDQILVSSFHGYISRELRSAEMPPLNTGSDQEFYEKALPEAFLEMRQSLKKEPIFDTLVLDEGQDLLSLEYIVCLDALLKGGMRDGHWHICYDPNQNIYNLQLQEGLEIIKDLHPVLLELDTNCRNTRPVGIYNTLLTGIPPARFYRVDGESVTRIAYENFEDERKKVVKTVSRLTGQGVRAGSIYLLSKYRLSNSCLGDEGAFGDIGEIRDITDLNPRYLLENRIKFCTIHGFKGLEAPVVLVLDVEGLQETDARSLNYAAMSRATSLLSIFYNRSVESEMQYMITSSAPLLKIIQD